MKGAKPHPRMAPTSASRGSVITPLSAVAAAVASAYRVWSNFPNIGDRIMKSVTWHPLQVLGAHAGDALRKLIIVGNPANDALLRGGALGRRSLTALPSLPERRRRRRLSAAECR